VNHASHNNKSGANGNAVRIILVTSFISLLATALLAWAAGTGFWFPKEGSTVAPQVDLIFNVITWISIFFFVLVTILMCYFMVKYRRREHSKATSDVTHNTPLELTWTIIPLILVIAIFYVGMSGYINLRRSPLGSYEVNVTASRWSWGFSHRSGLSEANVLLVPVGRPVRMVMQSTDVIHALYVPAFRVKQDIVPGRITDLWFNVKEPGEYELFCAEYCGKDHSQMHATVQAMEEDKFEAEMQKRLNVIKDLARDEFPNYAMTRIYPRCASCHSLDGKSGTGPTWRGVWHEIETGNVVFTDGSRLADLMGPGKMFETPEDYVRQSILNPQQKIVMNYTGAMPTFKGQLKDLEIQAVIEMLKHLDEFDNKGKPLPGTHAAEVAARKAAPKQ